MIYLLATSLRSLASERSNHMWCADLKTNDRCGLATLVIYRLNARWSAPRIPPWLCPIRAKETNGREAGRHTGQTIYVVVAQDHHVDRRGVVGHGNSPSRPVFPKPNTETHSCECLKRCLVAYASLCADTRCTRRYLPVVKGDDSGEATSANPPAHEHDSLIEENAKSK